MKMDVTAFYLNMMTLGVMRYFQDIMSAYRRIYPSSAMTTLNRFTLGTEITSVDQNVGLLAKTSCNELLAQRDSAYRHRMV